MRQINATIKLLVVRGIGPKQHANRIVDRSLSLMENEVDPIQSQPIVSKSGEA